MRAALFEPAGRPGYARLKMPIAEVKPAIFGHAEFAAFNGRRRRSLAQGGRRTPRLKASAGAATPRPLIETIAEESARTFRARRCSTPTTSIST